MSLIPDTEEMAHVSNVTSSYPNQTVVHTPRTGVQQFGFTAQSRALAVFSVKKVGFNTKTQVPSSENSLLWARTTKNNLL